MSARPLETATALLARLQAADPGVAQVGSIELASTTNGWQLSADGQALVTALEQLAARATADAEVVAVADILRRDQKFSPPGRPSLHLVQLRRQQSRVQLAQRTARQAWAAAAAAFVRQAGLPLRPGSSAGDSLLRWLATLPH